MTTCVLLSLSILSIANPGFAAEGTATRDSHRAPVRIVGSTVIVGESDPYLWQAVRDLLPARPKRIELLDLESLPDPTRRRLHRVDAVVLTGQATIVVIRQGATLRQAELGDSFDRLVLASLLWHEMSHANGLDENGALEQEQALWRHFIRQRIVSAGDGMAYISRLQEVRSTVTSTPRK